MMMLAQLLTIKTLNSNMRVRHKDCEKEHYVKLVSSDTYGFKCGSKTIAVRPVGAGEKSNAELFQPAFITNN